MTLPTVTGLTMPAPQRDGERGTYACCWSVETEYGEISGLEALMLLCE